MHWDVYKPVFYFMRPYPVGVQLFFTCVSLNIMFVSTGFQQSAGPYGLPLRPVVLVNGPPSTDRPRSTRRGGTVYEYNGLQSGGRSQGLYGPAEFGRGLMVVVVCGGGS